MSIHFCKVINDHAIQERKIHPTVSSQVSKVGSSVATVTSTRSALVVEASVASARPVIIQTGMAGAGPIIIQTGTTGTRPVIVQASMTGTWPVVSVETTVAGTRSAVVIQATMTRIRSTATIVSVVSVGGTPIHVEAALDLREGGWFVARERR